MYPAQENKSANFVRAEEKGGKRCAAGLVQRVEHLSFALGVQSLMPFVMYWPNTQPRGSLTHKGLTVSKI